MHCIVILSLISYHINRNIGNAASQFAASYLENTYKYRQQARYTFGASLILFVGSLCVLYWDGLPSALASINSVIMSIFIIIIAFSVNRMGQKKIGRKATKHRIQSDRVERDQFELVSSDAVALDPIQEILPRSSSIPKNVDKAAVVEEGKQEEEEQKQELIVPKTVAPKPREPQQANIDANVN